MKVDVTQTGLGEVGSDLVVVVVHEGEDLPDPVAGARGAGDVKTGFKKLTVVHPHAPERILVIGLGAKDEMTAEKARIAGAILASNAKSYNAESMAIALPESDDAAAIAAGFTTGVILGSFEFDRFRRKDDDAGAGLTALTLIGPEGLAAEAEVARTATEAQNRTRELQSLPSNVATPTFLANRAAEIAAAHDSIVTESFGPAEIAEKGMGGLAAVSQGGPEEPRLIVMRYSGGGDSEPLGFVGKAVTFDTGGISLKPGSGMDEMKFDMSGGAAVIEAVGALAELEVPINVIAVIPSTENMPSGTAVKPGDVITQYGGKTVEVNNTDAEGRLILADALGYCIELGATRVVDIATLTGAVVIALGSSFAGLVSNDDTLAAAAEQAGKDTGELLWRLPLHQEYTDLMKGKVADLSNLASKRKAGTLTAAAFLAEFVGDTPWAHLDIAGTGWDVGREYTGTGGSGFGTRLLVELARDLA